MEPDRATEAEVIAAVRAGRFGPNPGDTLMAVLYDEKVTAIYHLIDSPYVELVRALLDTGSDVNQCRSIESRLPLVVAAAHRVGERPEGLAMVRLLVEHGADVRAATSDGATALHSAVSFKYSESVAPPQSAVDLVRFLLEHGADPLQPTHAGETALSRISGPVLSPPTATRTELLRLLRDAARGEMAKRRPKTLTFKKRKDALDPARDVGIDALAAWLRNPELGWILFAVRAPLEDTARALVEAVPGARWERDCAKRHVESGAFDCFVTRLIPAEWTLVLYGSTMLVKYESSEETRAHAAAIAKTLGVDVVAAIGQRVVVEYAADGTQKLHEYGEDEIFYPGAKNEMLALFRERRIFVPPFAVTTNGLTMELVMHGLAKQHVERLDAVIFREV